MKPYQTRLKTEHSDLLYVQILQKLTGEKLYRDPGYNAQKLAADLGTNRRYISASVATHTGGGNYATLVNGMRLREVCRMLDSHRYAQYTVEEIGLLSGFASRQAFYLAFRKQFNITPREYRLGKRNTE